MPPLSVLANAGYLPTDQRYPGTDPVAGGAVAGGAVAGDDWFGAQDDASWWNPQDPKGSLDRLFGGQPPSSQTILAHAPQLQAVGIEVSPPNAEGVTSKIHIPGVGWTRILEGGVAGGQGTGWNYVPQGVTGPGGTQNLDGSPAGGGAAGGWPHGPRPYGIEAAPSAPPFELPQLNEQTDPGYAARLKMGTDALERSAAARGTLLTGGTLKGLNRFAQDYASNEYGNVFNRALGRHQTNFGNATTTWQGNLGAQNQGYNQLFGLAGLGANAAAGQAGSNSAYANTAGDLMTQQGNANAAGTVGAANAWGGAASGAANTAAQMWYLSKLFGSER